MDWSAALAPSLQHLANCADGKRRGGVGVVGVDVEPVRLALESQSRSCGARKNLMAVAPEYGQVSW